MTEEQKRRLQDAAFVVACLAVVAAIVVNAQLGPTRTLWGMLMRAG